MPFLTVAIVIGVAVYLEWHLNAAKHWRTLRRVARTIVGSDIGR